MNRLQESKVLSTLIEFLLRFRLIREVRIDAALLNKVLRSKLPKQIEIAIPNGRGNFSLLDIELKIPMQGKRLDLDLSANLEVFFLSNPLYQMHLNAQATLEPYYNPETKTISLRDPELNKLELLESNSSLVRQTQETVNKIIPTPLDELRTYAFQAADRFISPLMNSDATGTTKVDGYLKLYLSDGLQAMLDFHRPEIERILMRMITEEKRVYQLTEATIAQRLFARWGKNVEVDKGYLRFKF